MTAMRYTGINKQKKRKKLGPAKFRRRKEKIQDILLLLAQLSCILILLVHTVKKYAPDTMQCTHSFITTISDVEYQSVYRTPSVVFNTSEGKVFFNIDTGFALNGGEIINKALEKFEYLDNNDIEVNIRIRNKSDNNPLSRHYKEYEMVALEDDQNQIDKFEKNQKLSLVILCILLSLWLILAIAFYVLFRVI